MAPDHPARPAARDTPPDGFGALKRTSPLIELIGPVWSRSTGTDLELAMRIDGRHVNARGYAHGGVLATLVDIALGYAASSSQDPPAQLTTATPQ